jgi:N utilization substance protein B
MRKQAREYTFKLIFEYLFLKEKNNDGIDEARPENLLPSDTEYINKVYNGVVENYDYLYSCVSRLSSEFKAERIYKIDLAILLLAMYEIKFMDDVPDVVAVNEAIELAKTYSTDKSHSFINGILASFLKEIRNGANN